MTAGVLEQVDPAELAWLDQREAERRAAYALLAATAAEEDLVGVQVPTFMWCPPYVDSLGEQAAALYEEATRAVGGRLDRYQRLALEVALALDTDRVLVCFEVAIILSRQNGKGEILIALELAWLFLFGEKLIIHSAHLFETSREHFLKMQQVIEANPEFDRRVASMKMGRGSEEIVLRPSPSVIEGRAPRRRESGGARLKFMTRSGGAGRGFTGGKLVLDEAMYLDALMMAAGLPTMATRREGQVVYTGSAGMKHSTQLAKVRSRGRRPARGLPGPKALALLEWAAEKPIYDDAGRLVGGDDPEDLRTAAKVNPALGQPPRGRITVSYVRNEAEAMGGFDAAPWWTERLGIGDWPDDGERWEVIDKDGWKNAADLGSRMLPEGRVFAVDADPVTGVYALTVSGVREDKLGHIETVEQRRGSLWLVPRMQEIVGADVRKRIHKPPVILLKTAVASHLVTDLETGRWVVYEPTETQYVQSCTALVEELRGGKVVHIGQKSLTDAMGAAAKRTNVEGGWKWDRDMPGQSPVIGATLARWGVRKGYGKLPKSKVF